MNIYLGADHQGFLLKERLFAYLAKHGYNVVDIGDAELDQHDDFPQFAQLAALKVLGDEHDNARAILLCGDGQGMAMTANRHRGIRAAVVWDAHEAKSVRQELDSNVMCLPSRVLGTNDAAWQGIVETWLSADFSGAVRYRRRLSEMDEVA